MQLLKYILIGLALFVAFGIIGHNDYEMEQAQYNQNNLQELR